MNKTELIDALSEETTFSKRDVSRVLEAFARIVTRTLKKNDKVQWSGFGCFTVSKRAARNGRNPVTKQPMKIEGTVVPKFKAGKNLKEAIRGTLK
jgi:DNA-binding protein HU-beta